MCVLFVYVSVLVKYLAFDTKKQPIDIVIIN